MVNYNPARWAQNDKGWVCYVYDVGEPRQDCTDCFIIPETDGWCITDTTAGTKWRMAGPFPTLDSAKVGWRFIFG
jgi:hypothetical protein